MFNVNYCETIGPMQPGTTRKRQIHLFLIYGQHRGLTRKTEDKESSGEDFSYGIQGKGTKTVIEDSKPTLFLLPFYA